MYVGCIWMLDYLFVARKMPLTRWQIKNHAIQHSWKSTAIMYSEIYVVYDMHKAVHFDKCEIETHICFSTEMS